MNALPSWAWVYKPSLGHGLKYGGLLGFQSALTQGLHNVRGSLGFFGMSAGYDYKLLNNFSIGLTTGQHADVFSAYDTHTLNFTYFTKGTYSKGWNISADVGQQRCKQECIEDKDYHSLTWLSLGYSF